MPATAVVLADAGGVNLLPAIAADTARTGSGVDLSNAGVGDFDGVAAAVITTGAAGGSGVMKFFFEHSHDNSTWATCSFVGTAQDGNSPNTSGSNQAIVVPIDLGQTRRYLRVSSVLVSGTNLANGVALVGFKKASG